jgi:hypothetical protein
MLVRARSRIAVVCAVMCVTSLLACVTVLPLAHALQTRSSFFGAARRGCTRTLGVKRAAHVPAAHDEATCRVCTALAQGRNCMAQVAGAIPSPQGLLGLLRTSGGIAPRIATGAASNPRAPPTISG